MSFKRISGKARNAAGLVTGRYSHRAEHTSPVLKVLPWNTVVDVVLLVQYTRSWR